MKVNLERKHWAYIAVVAVSLVAVIFTILYSGGNTLSVGCEKRIDATTATCENNTLHITVKNVGPNCPNIPISVDSDSTKSEIIISVDNIPITSGVNWSNKNILLDHTSTLSIECQRCSSGSSHEIKIIGPQNVIVKSIVCT